MSGRKAAVGWGYLEVCDGEVRVLAETACTKEFLEKAETEKKLRSVEDSLKKDDLEPAVRRNLEKESRRLKAELEL